MFDATLLDESACEIRANFFGQAAENYVNKLAEGKVYTFSRGQVRVANRQFNRCSHRYELVFDKDALIEEVADDAKIKAVSFEITSLSSVQARALPCTVTVCGIVSSFRPAISFTSQQGKELVKRDLTLVDDSLASISVTIWGERAKQDDAKFENNPVMCLKGVAVKEWQGARSGSLLESGVLQFGTDIPEAKRVLEWWAKGGSSSNIASMSLAQEGLTDLKSLQTKAVPCTVGLCGVIVGFRPPFSFTSKEGRELTKREITVADDSAISMTVVLWGNRAKQDDAVFENNPLVSIQGVRVAEWNGGRNGSLLEAGSLSFGPTSPEAQRIKLWWSQGGSGQTLTGLSAEFGGGSSPQATGKASDLAELREEAERVSSVQGEVFSVVSRLALVQLRKQGEVQPLYYMACQEPKQGSSLPCQKRVDSSGFCAACNRVGKALPRMNLRCRFSDFADSVWLTTFHEAAQKVLGMTAEQAQVLEGGEEGREALEGTIRRQYFQQPMQITVRAKQDTWQGEVRANITCVDARPVQRGAHAREMLKSIKELLA